MFGKVQESAPRSVYEVSGDIMEGERTWALPVDKSCTSDSRTA